MGRANPWKAREADLRAAVEAGVTMAELGRRYGVKEQCVNMACWRLGIRVPRAVKSARLSALKRRQWSEPGYRQSITDASVASYHAGHGAVLAGSRRGKCPRWCPTQYLESYRAVMIKLRCAADARRIVEADIHRDLRRALSAIAAVAAGVVAARRAHDRSWQGQLERAARLGVSERVVMRRADYAFSLTGCSADL